MDTQKRIRQLMEERNWTDYRLAKEANLSHSTVTNMFNRNNAPTLPTLEAVCRAFGITLAQFFAEGEESRLTEEQQKLFSKWSTLTDRQKQILLELMDAIWSTSLPQRERCAFLLPLKKAPANRRSENKNFIGKFEMHPFKRFGCIVSIYGTQASKRICQWLSIHFWKHLRTNRVSYPSKRPFPLFFSKCQSCQLHIPFIQPINSTPPISKSTTQLSTFFHNRPVPTYP